MNRYVSKLAEVALITALGATTSGCWVIGNMMEAAFGVKREDRDVNYVIEAGNVTEEFKGSSDYIVVLISGNHISYGCAANTYLALEGLISNTCFVAREGRTGPTEHTNKDFQEHRYHDHNLKTKYYKDILSLSFEERKETACKWIEERKFPSQYGHSGTWAGASPMFVPVLIETVYQDKVQTIGVENEEALEKAKELTGPFSKADVKSKESLKIIFDDRNKHMVKRIEYYAAEIEDGELVPFVVGAGHVKHPFDPKNKMTLRAILKRKDISFKVLEHEPCKVPVDD